MLLRLPPLLAESTRAARAGYARSQPRLLVTKCAMIRFVLMVNKQGQTRLAQYVNMHNIEERCALEAEVIRKCLARNEAQCSFFEFRGYKVVYRRYASLFFIVGVEGDDEVRAACILRSTTCPALSSLPRPRSHGIALPPPEPLLLTPATHAPLFYASSQNELAILEFIHALVETLDRYFENVCELDIMFNLEKVWLRFSMRGGLWTC